VREQEREYQGKEEKEKEERGGCRGEEVDK
jgi:hypothetical protein